MVFADTSGFIAAADANDARHQKAAQAWRRISQEGESVLTTDLVLAETVTLVRRRAGWVLSRKIGETILQSRVVQLVCLDREQLDAAWREFLRLASPKMSLCDAASFVTMRERGVTRAFTFDGHFADAGFSLLP
jgi:predicted nucleic acid-binding protein